MSRLLTLSLLSLSLRLFGQECSCLSQFSFVKNYYQRNNPAFQIIKNDPTAHKNYIIQVKKLTTEISKEKSNDRCNIYFDKYVSLLKDHHSGIDVSLQRLNLDLNSQKSVDSFRATKGYKSFKKIEIDTVTLLSRLKTKPQADVEGLYRTSTNIILAVMETQPGSYMGVVMKKNKLLDVGHILLELKKRDNTNYECVYHTGLLAVNFENVYGNVEIKNGQIAQLGFSKIGAQNEAATRPYAFRELDSTTNYIKLTSFERKLKPELDSFYRSIDGLIQSKPYLIIDLRDNGGGAEECYFSLLKYVYTRPLQIDNVDVWVSPDNIARYEEIGASQTLINRMKKAKPFGFIPQLEGPAERWTMEGTTNPKKVALLFNRKTASSAEGMITYAMQSDKVITMGENSGGHIGFGDVMTTKIPCGKYSLRSTTTKYHNNSRYEFVGIAPKVYLSAEEDWIEVARKMLH
jgi:hypothetical protein